MFRENKFKKIHKYLTEKFHLTNATILSTSTKILYENNKPPKPNPILKYPDSKI